MIRTAGMRIWERENQQGPPGDQKMPMTSPNWNHNTEAGRRDMSDYHNLLVRGIKEAAPRGQNVSKAFNSQQGKEESPTEWLERLRKNMQQYSGIDPTSPAGQALLKVNFVTHAWPDIKKKLEKLDDWQNRGLDKLLREAQKVYVRRDEEKVKSKAEIMVATMQGVNTFKPMTPSRVETPRNNAPRNRGRGRSRPLMGAREL